MYLYITHINIQMIFVGMHKFANGTSIDTVYNFPVKRKWSLQDEHLSQIIVPQVPGVKNGTKYLAHLGAKFWEMIVSEIKQSNPFHVLTTELRHGNLTNAYTVYTSS